MPATRVYEVVALAVPIAYNAHGDHDRDGALFTLARHEAALRELGRGWAEGASSDGPPAPHPLVRPLVLRARVGERLRIGLRNELPRRAGIHPQGVRYDVERADGGVVAVNPDSAADPGGGRRDYVWDCEHEGVFFFGDLADLRGGEHGAQAHGLFGALVVEPADSVWTDPETGEPVEDGLAADVHVPGEPSFREYTVLVQDGSPNHGAPSGCGGSATLVGYRSEPAGSRAAATERRMAEGVLDPVRDAVVGEEAHRSSWLHGDPATPVLRAYAGDRTRIRLVHAGVGRTHVFRLHGHRWPAVPGDERAPVVDTVALGPQQAVTVEPVAGAGSVHRAAGDLLWDVGDDDGGAWGLWRVFDVAQDGTAHYPDGSPIAPLRPLPGHPAPPAPTAERPGFPAFVPGAFPGRPPRPPRTPRMPPGMGREPTARERAAFCPDPRPGEAFTAVCPDPDAPVRRYDLVVLQGVLDHRPGDARTGPGARRDERGVLFVLREEVDDAGGVEPFRAGLADGSRTAAPLAIRARAGEVVELSLTNALPPGCRSATAFDPLLPFQPECGLHGRLVAVDPLVADGAAVGWNYLSGATTADAGAADDARYRTWLYRWYCDEELGTVVLSDGLAGGARGRHGLYGALVVEPAGARWTDPHDPGRPVANAPAAVVTRPDGTGFREQVLAVADRVALFADGPGAHRPGAHEPGGSIGSRGGAEPIDPPPHPGAPGEHGAMAVGYRCEPLRGRPGDPADWFSSRVHGDPATPLLRAYPGEEIRLRIHHGAGAGHHGVVGGGLRWRAGPGASPGSAPPLRGQQSIGPGQAADLHVEPPAGPGDRMWSCGASAGAWLGAWGLVRVHGAPADDLPPLASAFRGPGLPPVDPAAVRRHHVRVHAREIRYSDARTDPLALVYALDGEPGAPGSPGGGPLVVRARVGEWVEVTLTNELPGPPPASAFDPRLPDEADPGARAVSERVSLHPGPLLYDVCADDGAAVGENPDSTVKPGQSVVYRWFADAPGAVLLTDRADVRTHARRGLVGVLVVEPADATPYDPRDPDQPCWTGERALVRRPEGPPVHELVLLLTDGLRLYHDGDLTQPVCDLGAERADAGQKALNHRSAHLLPARPSLADPNPPTPTLTCAPGDRLALHLVVGADRARHHGVTVHGHTWAPEDRPDGPHVGTVGPLGAGSVRHVDLVAGAPGDYAYRTGAVRWGLTEGLWGLIRVR